MEAGVFNKTFIRGQTWDDTLQLWSDTANTQPFSLAGWDAALVFLLPAPLTLTPGHGLTMGGASGTISVFLGSGATAAVRVDQCRWYLQLTDPDGDTDFAWGGIVTWANPGDPVAT